LTFLRLQYIHLIEPNPKGWSEVVQATGRGVRRGTHVGLEKCEDHMREVGMVACVCMYVCCVCVCVCVYIYIYICIHRQALKTCEEGVGKLYCMYMYVCG
jgi:hypothetical protein